MSTLHGPLRNVPFLYVICIFCGFFFGICVSFGVFPLWTLKFLSNISSNTLSKNMQT